VAEALHNDRTNQTVLCHFLHLLKAFPLEGSAGYAVIYLKAVFDTILFLQKNGFKLLGRVQIL